MGWVALDRAAKVAHMRGDSELRERWQATADEIRADVLERGLSARGVLRQHYDKDALDASTLLAPLIGFFAPGDERAHDSVLAIADELTEDGFVLRYRTDETDDGMPGKEGSFLICSYWLVSALSVVGEHQRARDQFEAAPARRFTAGALRRGVRRGHRVPPRQVPAGVLAPGPDRGGRSDHPGGMASRVATDADHSFSSHQRAKTALWRDESGGGTSRQPRRSVRCSPTRRAFAIAVSAGFTAPMLGKKLVSTT
jgi:hypothetical protein